MTSFSIQEDIDGHPGSDIDLNIDPDHVKDYRDVPHKPLSQTDLLYRWYVAFSRSSRALDSVLEVAHTQAKHTDLKVGVYLKDDSEFVDIQVWCDIQSKDLTTEEIRGQLNQADRSRYLIFRVLFDQRINVRKVKMLSQDRDWAIENQNKGSNSEG